MKPRYNTGKTTLKKLSEKVLTIQNAVPGNDRHHKEMDGPPPGLGPDSFPAGDLF